MDHARVKGLDSVRGIAALIVIMCHLFRLVFQESNPRAFQFELNFTFLQFLVNGHLAVMIFFVLSGFVLCYTVFPRAEAFSYKTYLIRRITRIYIPYIIVMLFSWGLFDTVAASAHHLPLSWDDWAPPRTLKALAGMFLMGGFVGDNYLDGVTWTLFIEMQISLIFPLLVFALKKYRWQGLVGCLAISLVSSKLYVVFDGNSQFTMAHTLLGRLFLTLYYLQYFAVGAFIFLNGPAIQARVQKIPLQVHLAVIASLLLFPFKFYGGHFLVAGAIYLATAGLIVIYSISFKQVALALSIGTFQWLGRISYSLYLIHPPILFTFTFLFYRWLPMDLIVLIALPIIFVAADLSQRFVETPSIALGRKLVAGWRSSTVPLA